MIDIEEELVRVKDDNARLRGALRRIDTGDFGSWGCDCPARDIARAALTATEPTKPFHVGCGTAPDDAPEDLRQLPQMTVDIGSRGWIRVEDELPDDVDIRVWVVGRGRVDSGYYLPNAKEWLADNECAIYEVTHWMPIVVPTEPEEE